MLALATMNVVGAVVFAVLYATVGARRVPQGAFVACFVVVFAVVTALWVRVEARHQALEPLRRAGRIATALVVVVGGVAAFALIPAFWLEPGLPRHELYLGHFTPLMTLTLTSLAVVVIVNVAGAAFVVARGVLRSRPGASTH